MLTGRKESLSLALVLRVSCAQLCMLLTVDTACKGMSCAHHLSQHPDKFDVTVIDAVDYCGGQAFSIPIDKGNHGASWLNQGVQGGSNIFHHTMTMFSRQGYHADPVKLQVRSSSHLASDPLNQILRSHSAKMTSSGIMSSRLLYSPVMPKK